MTATVTISADVESVAIQTIAIALNVTGTDAQCRVHWLNHLKDVTAKLYVKGDQMKRATQADSAAVAAAASKITVS